MDLLWGRALCAHPAMADETMMSAVSEAVVSLLPFMSDLLLSYLFSKLAALSACDYTEAFLALVQAFAHAAIQKHHDRLPAVCMRYTLLCCPSLLCSCVAWHAAVLAG